MCTEKVEVFDDLARPTLTSLTVNAGTSGRLPAALAGTYKQSVTYDALGNIDSRTLPAVPGMPAETIH
ncbi:hypothetical protein [Aquipuribacter nitratireducens]|uniref:YD repeat-containing protein n=1 Tax=Aquipuribacter nitratireducens TaxID=650104 RepID=A0ABW0GT09_9MICO